jgi:hypothetical protein
LSAVGRDLEVVRGARLEAASLLLTLYGEFRRFRVRPALRLWCLAGLSGTLEMVADADEALRGADGSGGGWVDVPGSEEGEEAAAASVAAWLAPLAEVSPASDLHAQLAARAGVVARRRAGEGWVPASAAAEADLACARAHALRYGQGLEQGAALRLVALSEQLAFEGIACYGATDGAVALEE